MVRCTVAIPTYNREDMIRGALESVFVQDMDDLEILVIDDQSQDNVLEIAASYGDPRLQIIRNDENLGIFGNFNRCIELARGPFLRILCNDDRLIEGCLRREVEFMEDNPDVSLLFSRGRRLTREGVSLGIVGNHFPKGIYRSREAVTAILWFFAHYGFNPITLPSGVLMRASACHRAGRFDESMLMDGDFDYYLRMLMWGELGVMDAIGCEISIHEEQMSSVLKDNPDITEEHFAVAEKNADYLRDAGTWDRINEQLSAWALLDSYKLRWNGKQERAHSYRELARRNCPNRGRLLAAVVRCVWLRTMLKLLKIRRIPAKPRIIA